MNQFIYYSPTKIYFGKYEQEVGNIIKNLGYNKILFHYGKKSIFENGLYEKVKNSLIKYGISFIELGNVEPNPKIDLVRSGVELAKKNQVDFILAVGGGSVIDSSKAIACGAKVDFDPWQFSIHEKEPKEALPIGVILTISAAGSELSNSCVISNPKVKIKNGFNSDLIRPVFSIMNPEITYTVSKYQTACGIVDIMMHTMERYFVDGDNLLFTEGIALSLLKNVLEAGKVVMNNPFDKKARAELMIASSFSHNGLTGMGSKMYFTVHKLEHALSGLYDNIAHGAGLSILFPAWAKWVYPHLKEKFSKFSEVVMEINEDDTELKINMAIDNLKKFYHEIGMPTSFREIGLDKNDLKKIANVATNNGTKVISSFVKIELKEVLEILELAF